DIPPRVAVVAEASEQLRAAVDSAFPEAEPSAAVPAPGPEKLSEVAARLENLLMCDDFQAAEVLSQAGPVLQAAFGPLASKLEEEVRSFNYPAALATLRGALEQHRLAAQSG
ncbi:MAG TPA: hypothetical protein VFF03_02065, partial [Rhodocyclaceae bacterium]|nr:hypothetical protein [Rhodocyclaceae bacterium]